MKAKDLMVPLTEHLMPGATLKEAACLLKTAKRAEERHGVRALPVLNEQGQLVGILSIGDILKAIYPRYLYLMDLGEFTWDGMVESIARKMADRTVRECMTTRVITVNEYASLMECVDHMLKNGVKRVPVVDRQGTVVGMLYERDLFYKIAGAMLEKGKKECP